MAAVTLGEQRTINRATCEVLGEEQRGTGWLCSSDGYILTAGHIVTNGQPKSITQDAEITVRIKIDNTPYEGVVVFCIFAPKENKDFALVKIDLDDAVPFIKMDTTNGVDHYLAGHQVYINGYGERNSMYSTPDIGDLLAPYGDTNNPILKIRCPDAVQKGISGAAVFSFDTRSVIGIQTKASLFTVGATSEDVLAMPISSILDLLKSNVPEITQKLKKEHQQHKSNNDKIVTCGSQDYLEESGVIIRQNKVDEIRNSFLQDAKIVIVHGVDGLGKLRIVRQVIRESPDLFSDYQIVTLKETVEFDDLKKSTLLERIINNITFTPQINELLGAYSRVKQWQVQKQKIAELDSAMLIVIESAKDIDQETIVELTRYSCKFVLISSEPCDFIDDSSILCKTISLAFDPESDYDQMNRIFEESFNDDLKLGTIKHSVRKKMFESLDYHTQFVVLLAKVLESAENPNVIIDMIIAGKLESISHQITYKTPTLYDTPIEHINGLILQHKITDIEKPLLILLALIGQRKINYKDLHEFYNVMTDFGFRSLHNKGVLSYNTSSGNISINPVLLSVYYSRLILKTKDNICESLNTVAQGLINKYNILKSNTFSDAQNALDSINRIIKRVVQKNIDTLKDSICVILSDEVNFDSSIKLNLLTTLAEHFNALGMKDESSMVLQLIQPTLLNQSSNLRENLLQCSFKLAKLFYSVDDVKSSIEVFEKIISQPELIGDNWRTKGLILQSLIDLFPFVKDDNKILSTGKEAISLYLDNGQPFGAIMVLIKLMWSVEIPIKETKHFLRIIEQKLLEMPENAIELSFVHSFDLFKEFFSKDISNASISQDDLMYYIINKINKPSAFILRYKLNRKMDKMISLLNPLDPASQLFFSIYDDEASNPDYVTKAIYAFYEQFSKKFEELGYVFGFVDAYRIYISLITNHLGNFIEINKVLANELLMNRIKEELILYRNQLLLTNVDVVTEKAAIYHFLLRSLGINEALKYLREYENEIKSIPEAYKISKVKSLEALGDLYSELSSKVNPEYCSQFQYNSRSCYNAAIKIVPETSINTKVRLLSKVEAYQQAYDILTENKICNCIFCDCCYHLAKEALYNDESKLFEHYFKGINRASRKSVFCNHDKCLRQKQKTLLDYYRRLSNNKNSSFVRFTELLISVLDGNKQLVAKRGKKFAEKRGYNNTIAKRYYKALRHSLRILSPEAHNKLFGYLQASDIFDVHYIKTFIKFIKKNDPIKFLFLSLFLDNSISNESIRELCLKTVRERDLFIVDGFSGIEVINDLYIQKIIRKYGLHDGSFYSNNEYANLTPSRLVKSAVIEMIHETLFSSVGIGFIGRGSDIATNYNLFCDIISHEDFSVNDYIHWLKQTFWKSPKTDLRFITSIILDQINGQDNSEYQKITMGQSIDVVYLRLRDEFVEELLQQKRQEEAERKRQAEIEQEEILARQEKITRRYELNTPQPKKRPQRHELKAYTTKIPANYFASTYMISKIIEQTVEVIGEHAFYGHGELSSLRFGSNVKIIEKEIISGTSLKELFIPSGVVKMSYSLAGATHLKKVSFEEGMECIPSHALASYSANGIYSAIEEVVLPESTTLIGEGAFLNCVSLSKFEMPASLHFIGSRAFSGCCSMEKIKIPDRVTWIGDEAFKDCTSLTSIELGNHIVHIGKGFIKNTPITSLVIKSDIISMAYAFEGARNIEEIEFVDGCTVIPRYAFATKSGDINFNQINLTDTIISIEDSAFRNCANLIDVPESDELIFLGESCFRGCKGLVNVQIPAKVKEIGQFAFSGCSNLHSISLNDSVRKLGQKFLSFTQVTKITIPKSVEIMEYALVDINTLTHVIFEEGTKVIPSKGLSALYEKKQMPIRQVSLPDTVEVIGFNAFFNCTKILSIDMPSNLRVIEKAAFEGCRGLKEIRFPATLETIGEEAFLYCTNLKTIFIGRKTKYIGSGFIAGTNVSTVLIPKSVSNMRFAFRNTFSVRRVVFEEGTTTISARALFFEDSVNVQVYIPESVTSIHFTAFENADNVVIHCVKGSYADEYANKACIATSYDSLPIDFKDESQILNPIHI